MEERKKCICGRPLHGRNSCKTCQHRAWVKNNPELVKLHRSKHKIGLEARFRRAALKAAARGLVWNLEYVDWLRLIEQPCIYCKEPLTRDTSGHSLDRKQNIIGYQLDNVVPCCYRCNKVKFDCLSHEEMLVAMAAVLQLRSGH